MIQWLWEKVHSQDVRDFVSKVRVQARLLQFNAWNLLDLQDFQLGTFTSQPLKSSVYESLLEVIELI